MTDLRLTIAPKSDQLTADDLIAGPKTIEITSVSLTAEPDQPVAIGFVDDNGRPYKPCKSMRRVMVTVWGPDGNTYAGRKMTLLRDDDVKFGGMAVGGIRVSHMSHITRPITMALTATRANKKPYTVQPLIEAQPEPARQARVDETKIDAKIQELVTKFMATESLQAHHRLVTEKGVSQSIEWLKKARPDRYQTELHPFITASYERNNPPAQLPEEPPSDPVSFDQAIEFAS